MVQERVIEARSGWVPLLGWLLGLVMAIAVFVVGVTVGVREHNGWLIGGAVGASSVAIVALLIAAFGFMVVNPNDSRVLVLFGEYVGSVKKSGFFWVNPFYSKARITLRVRNFETGWDVNPEKKDVHGSVTQSGSRKRVPTKVNDRDGNPIEIAAVVVWQVVDTAAALFQVDNYEDFVHVQSESALRNLVSQYHYDSEHDDVQTLRGHTAVVADKLKHELHDRLATAGVEILEARISYLAYAPEIASAMLRRQQATAIIAARQKIVEGAVGMVDMALKRLDQDKIVELDGDRKAAMVSNLLVVLCGVHDAQPVLNTGTIYH